MPSDRFTLACVWLSGAERRRAYSAQYVLDLQAHVLEAVAFRDFDMVCLTNVPDKVPAGIRAVPIPWPRDSRKRKARGWWGKVQLFNMTHKLAAPGSRVLYMDLDTLPVGSLTPILDFPSRFVLCPDSAPSFPGKGNRRTVHRYNSSVIVWDYGLGSDIYDIFEPEMTQILWGDQDWIGFMNPCLDTFPQDWFARLTPDGPVWGPETRVVLCNKWKPHQAREKWPWFAKMW